MATESSSAGGGVGVLGLLGVAFVVLKLVGVIDWSWWWVTAPFWGGALLVVIGLLAIGAGYLVFRFIEKRNARKAAAKRAALRKSRGHGW